MKDSVGSVSFPADASSPLLYIPGSAAIKRRIFLFFFSLAAVAASLSLGDFLQPTSFFLYSHPAFFFFCYGFHGFFFLRPVA